jgi:hypothetical protein
MSQMSGASSSPLSVAQASQIAKTTPALAQNTEPGFANTYGPGAQFPGGLLESAVPAAGVGALGLLMLYRRYRQDQHDQQDQQAQQAQQAQRPQRAQRKQAGLEDIRAQLPGIHAKDMLLGGAIGGSAGLIYDAAKGAPKGKRLSSALKRVLGGAVIGATGANVLGDRFRRYHSNVMIPAGYDASAKAKQLVPKSVRQFLDAAIYDKPAFDPKDVAQLETHFGNRTEAVLGARRELNRIAQGVHTSNPKTDYWQKNVPSNNAPYYSANEKNPNYNMNAAALFAPTGIPEYAKLVADPEGYIAAGNAAKAPWQTTGSFGADTLLGGQQVIAKRDGNSVVGRILDRYDVTPSQSETQEATEAVKKLKVFNPNWWTQQREKAPGDYNAPDTTNAGFMANLLSRLAWDRVLTEEHPWVSQNFKITPAQASSWFPWRKAQPPKLELNTEAGR